MDKPLGTANARTVTPAHRPARPVGLLPRVAALVLAGVALCAVALMAGPPGLARAQTPPPIIPPLPGTPIIAPLPGTTLPPLVLTPTPIGTPLVVPTLRPPVGTPAPVVIVTPVAPPVIVTPAVPVVVVTPVRAPAQVPSGPGVAAPPPIPAATPRPAAAPPAPAQIPQFGSAEPSTAPPILAGIGALLVAAGIALRRRGRSPVGVGVRRVSGRVPE